MPITVTQATPADAAALLHIHNEASRRLTADFGEGPWTSAATEKGVLFTMRRAMVYVARDGDAAVATFALSLRKPWAIDKKYFSAGRQPLYLTSMAVHPARQREGVGALCIGEARRIAKVWPADAIRLDAWDAPAGAGGFYSRCGFREVGRATYRLAPLIYFELLL